MSRPFQNTLVLFAAAFALWVLISTQTNCLSTSDNSLITKERCFGLALATANLCATSADECLSATKTAADASSWLLLPVGVCAKLGGKVGAP